MAAKSTQTTVRQRTSAEIFGIFSACLLAVCFALAGTANVGLWLNDNFAANEVRVAHPWVGWGAEFALSVGMILIPLAMLLGFLAVVTSVVSAKPVHLILAVCLLFLSTVAWTIWRDALVRRPRRIRRATMESLILACGPCRPDIAKDRLAHYPEGQPTQ